MTKKVVWTILKPALIAGAVMALETFVEVLKDVNKEPEKEA